jgi:predicted transcriptional regulator of viral defense system
MMSFMDRAPESHAGWTFLTNHSRVLAAIADDRTTRVRDIAARCRLTERAVQKIIADLEGGGYLTHVREGRSNVYSVATDKRLRHPADAPATVAELLSILIHHESTYATASSAPTASSAEGHEAP